MCRVSGGNALKRLYILSLYFVFGYFFVFVVVVVLFFVYIYIYICIVSSYNFICITFMNIITFDYFVFS